MNSEFLDNRDEKLEDALAMLAAGITIEQIVAEAGNDAEWLRPLLELAAEVGDLQQAIPVPPPDASLQKLLSYGEDLASTPQDGQTTFSKLIKSWWSRLFIGVVVALLIGGLYILIPRNTAIDESTSPTEMPSPISTTISPTPSLPAVTDTPTLVPIPTDVPDSTATLTPTHSPESPTATSRPAINSTSDTIMLPSTPTSTSTVPPTVLLIEPIPTNTSSPDGNQGEDDANGIGNILTPTVTVTIPPIAPIPTSNTPDNGNDNTNGNANDDNSGDDSDSNNDNSDDGSDNGNSGPGGGDDNSGSSDNSGSGSSDSGGSDDDSGSDSSDSGDDDDKEDSSGSGGGN